MVTLIKNIILVDGSGQPPVKADVLIRDKKIVAVGSFPTYKADEIINGNESYLVPGFIDPDVTSDRYLTLFSAPYHKNFIEQGVTSGIIGQCGFSLAPNFYGDLGHFSNWAFSGDVNIDWMNIKEFLSSLSKMSVGINIGTLVGHGVIRDSIVKDISEKFRKLSANEIRIFRSAVDDALKEGAFGLSTGLGYPQYSSTPYYEMRAILDVVKKYDGVYSTHLRNEREKIVDSVEETIKISQDLQITTVITHLRPFNGFEKEYKLAKQKIENSSNNSDIYFNTNPFNLSAVLIDSLIPDKFRYDNKDALIEKMKSKEFEREMLKWFPKIDSQKIIIFNVPKMPFLSGKSLYDFASNRGLSDVDAIIELMKISDFKATILYENLNNDLVKESILSERSLISTSSPSFDLNFNDSVSSNHISKNGNSDNAFKKVPDRAVKTFTEFLKISNSSGVNIETAIEKITGLPAKVFKISNRGFVAEGMFADIVMLNKDLEISNVMNNGNWILRDGEFRKIIKDTATALMFRKTN